MSHEHLKPGRESAFPTLVQYDNAALTTGGITVRDYFAAKAMEALIIGGFQAMSTNPSVADAISAEFKPAPASAGAYAYADAMIAERSKKSE